MFALASISVFKALDSLISIVYLPALSSPIKNLYFIISFVWSPRWFESVTDPSQPPLRSDKVGNFRYLLLPL